MAIARGAGTEIIRSITLLNVNTSTENLIYGVRHHIYTVLSVVCFARVLGSAGNYIEMNLLGYDNRNGTAQQEMIIFRQDLQVNQTFVWNDKFSFNGYEPVDHGGAVNTEAEQDAIADQLVSGDSNRQVLRVEAENASDNVNIICTYIDQNNS